MDTAGLVTLVGQLGFAAAAYRLSKQLAKRVEKHELKLDDHDVRIKKLEG